MGQFALGIRSLVLKAAVFIVMAALLAWALGGTLWPKPARVNFYPGSYFGRDLIWRLSVRDAGGTNSAVDPEDFIRWELAYREKNDDKSHVLKGLEGLEWIDVAGPVFVDGKLYVGARPFNPSHSGSSWEILVLGDDQQIIERSSIPDRLAVEQQLARVAAGLPIQDAETILQQRPAVLDPQTNSADESTLKPRLNADDH